ncbi:ABC transporter ATP-binding protein [Geobacter sp. DSM 9736]|uniref:ABC transporter ATP-binding protein n=1 Tax=Geobacter sp. DSM 9736 TaxID=1277350 RepID=UPI000B50ACFC|nr:ABC transporter ATP-binding protein [Geobacter sp. DSM 9736]SNB46828.1 amino acid/amide ABC transporter ATP-binding protein 1, HAAT family [Geobacter sp. DSM 9736]
MASPEILVTEGLSVQFGGVRALGGVSVKVVEGEILSIIGPNGAGKTTFFNAVTGTFTPTGGKVFYEGREITGRKPFEVARMGLARSFQNLKPFAEMTLLENVLIGREIHMKSGMLAAIARTAAFRNDEKHQARKARELLEFVGLERRRDHLARNLTYGERKMLEIARALAVEPRVLLLDEPVAGMNPTETGFVMELVRKIGHRGITVVMIEHDMRMVMGISDRICVIDHGELIAEGKPQEIRSNPEVIRAYLGGGKHAPTH